VSGAAAPARCLALALLLLPAGCAAPGSAPAAGPAALPPTAELAPGVRHRYLRRAAGPWAIHVVEADPRACGVELRARKAGARLTDLEPTSEIARGGAVALGRPVLAAVNADFYSARPLGIPLGPHVESGEVVKLDGPHPRVREQTVVPGRDAFGVAADGAPFVATVRLSGRAWPDGGDGGPIGRLNVRPAADTLALWTPAGGETTPIDPGAAEAVLRRLGKGAAGDTLRGVVVLVDTLAAGVAVPADGVVLGGRGRWAPRLRGLQPGDTVAWAFRVHGAPGPVAELVGGFPLLLRDGAAAYGVPEVRPAFGEQRHPRTAVGIRPDGTVLLVVVDGRRPEYSDGMTLAELADLMRELGARDALNLDGGGSTTLVLGGRVVNRPTDAAGERPVTNALLVLGPAPGTCGVPG
jgi:large repetitive protein